MKAVRAEFAVRRGPGWWHWGLVVCGLLAAVGLQWHAREIALRRADERLAVEQRAQEAAEELERAARRPLPFAESLAELRQLRSVQWPRLLSALEVTPRGDLQVMSIDLNVAQQHVDVAVNAPTMKAVLDYVHALHEGLPQGEMGWRFGAGRVSERAGGFVAELRGTWSAR